MTTFQGIAHHINKKIIGKITKNQIHFFKRNGYILVCSDYNCKSLSRYSGLILTAVSNEKASKTLPVIYCGAEKLLNELKDDDIVLLSPDGKVSVLWESESNQNTLLLTEHCNCKCLMCPQPPRRYSEEQFTLNKQILSLVDRKKTKCVCITGGEPTILGDKFIEILELCKKILPDTEITVLTNGTQFANFEFSKQVATIGLRKLVICVALYADTDTLHDNITRTKGSFYNTVKGIHNLAKFNHNIEIRFVINKLNYERLHSFATFVYRNFPFVIHVALMGLEIHGYAEKNFNTIWIDPSEYNRHLRSAILELNRCNIHTSIYNIPLCLIPNDIWPYARKSISAWKNDYLPLCEECSEREFCCGIFTTSKFQSQNIKPINMLTK